MNVERGTRNASSLGRILVDGLLVVALFGATLCLGVSLGRDYERVNAVTAEPSPPIVIVGRKAAVARIDPICRVRMPSRRQLAPVEFLQSIHR